MNIKQSENTDFTINHGIVVGTGVWVPKPLDLEIVGKISIHKNFAEYKVELKRQFRRIYSFIRYYNIKTYSELSIGIGLEFTYSFKYQRNEY